MRRRQDPWKWPATGLVVLLFLGGLLLVPAAWVESFFSPLDLQEETDTAGGRRWLTILPPPEIEVAPPELPEPPDSEPEAPRPPRGDPRWWTAAWEVRAGVEAARDLRAAAPDSSAVVLQALGLGEDFMARVRPDSVMAQRLMLLRHEDSFRFDELKPYLAAMGRARDYADIMSRAADMYGEHLQSEIMTPD